MKKIIISIALILSGCASITLHSENDKCITTNEFEVLQALDTGALAYECTFWEGCSSFNQVVFLEKQLNIDYYDGLIVKSPKGKCAVHNGVYSYTNKQEIRKTVPVIKFEYKNPPKNEEEFYERAYEFKEIAKDECLTITRIKDDKEDKKFCECYAEEIANVWVKTHLGEGPVEEDKFYKDTEKKCGKYPESMK